MPLGRRSTIEGLLPRPIQLFVPDPAVGHDSLGLVVHFHGAPFVAETAVADSAPDYAVVVVNLGAGSGVYERPFSQHGSFESLLAAVRSRTAELSGHPVRFGDITLTAFSAGYGAVRAILRDSAAFRRVDGVLLLDGLHTGYVPEGRTLYEGGAVDSVDMEPFLRFARAATRGEKRMLITHSEIFPGTFASTTETTDYLIRQLGLRRSPVLAWGPGGMQQLSRTEAGRLRILGFAGNAAPDHVDHLHGLPTFLARLLRL